MKSVTMLKTTTLALLLAVFASACEPSKKQEDSSEMAKDANDETFTERDDEKDADFIVNTVAASYAEIKLAQLALSRSSDAEVKQMATVLVADHTKVITELKGYAAKNGIAIPLEETEAAMKDRNDLAEKNAEDFDKKWCKMLEGNHKKTVSRLEARIDKTEDAELKNWIAGALPALKSHLEMLKDHDEDSQ